MRTIPQYVCGVIPPHILTRVAEQTADPVRDDARATLEHMRELATDRTRTLVEASATARTGGARKRRNGRHGRQRWLPKAPPRSSPVAGFRRLRDDTNRVPKA